jgi:hypothetical protein
MAVINEALEMKAVRILWKSFVVVVGIALLLRYSYCCLKLFTESEWSCMQGNMLQRTAYDTNKQKSERKKQWAVRSCFRQTILLYDLQLRYIIIVYVINVYGGKESSIEIELIRNGIWAYVND